MESNVFTFNLPDIGEGVVEGEVIEWLKKEGDILKQDEPVVVVMTDKATVELPSPYPGMLLKQYYKVGEIAIKDKPLYDIRLNKTLEKKNIKPDEKQSVKTAESAPNRPSNKVPPPFIVEIKTSGKILATPKVRCFAKEMGIDIAKIKGTGSQGRITIEDLTTKSKEEFPLETRLNGDKEQPLVGIKRVMAKKMAQGRARLAQFSYFEQVDVTRLIQLRQNFKVQAESEGIHLSYMPFFIKALSLTAQQYPIVNSSIDMQKETLIYHQQHNVGIATATTQGLIVPILKGVELMSMEGIIKAYEILKNKTLAGKLTPSDMQGATITLSNFGVLEGDGLWATPMINDPEVAILAVARIRKVPVVKGNEILIRDLLPLSWSFDHRIIDGELAAIISHYFSVLLKDPAFLL